MHNNTDNTPDPLSSAEMRKFGLVTGLIIVVLFGFLLPWIFKGDGWVPWPFSGELLKPTWPWIVAIVLWVPALLYPPSLRPIYKVWIKIGDGIGYVNSRIILFIFFYLILAPFGAVLRLFGFDPMRRKLDDSSSTYRVESKIPTSPESMERPY